MISSAKPAGWHLIALYAARDPDAAALFHSFDETIEERGLAAQQFPPADCHGLAKPINAPNFYFSGFGTFAIKEKCMSIGGV